MAVLLVLSMRVTKVTGRRFKVYKCTVLLLKLTSRKKQHWHATYFARFPEVANIINAPASEKEQKIAKGFEKSGKYKFTPSFIRMTDNSDKFASKNEWNFD